MEVRKRQLNIETDATEILLGTVADRAAFSIKPKIACSSSGELIILGF